MSEELNDVLEIKTEEEQEITGKGVLIFFSIIFLIVSVIFAFVGVCRMYTYGHIVRGDAYNYIIIANRGIAWICVGIISAIIGCTLAILSKE
ncbi:hypothetical protein DRO69_02795 [Candidatus Bathyarchaeota archaeon]|nr:MAG: hypothetical protein DRO69_02795 [Candidatus Bathyarchaeota archaeon]